MAIIAVIIIVLVILVIVFSGGSDGNKLPAPRTKKSKTAKTAKTREDSIEPHKAAGNKGEKIVQEELSRLKGGCINGYITSQNIFFNGSHFEIDFLIMVPDFGFIVAEVKYMSGKIHCDHKPEWYQKKHNQSPKSIRNPCKQVLRTRGLFKKLLKANNLDHWPIKPLVIYSHPSIELTQGIGLEKADTEIIRLPMLEGWINNLKNIKNKSFSQQQFKEIYKLIKDNEQEFKKTA